VVPLDETFPEVSKNQGEGMLDPEVDTTITRKDGEYSPSDATSHSKTIETPGNIVVRLLKSRSSKLVVIPVVHILVINASTDKCT
jgi:hypothetical protein